jgi:hypothetical protein
MENFFTPKYSVKKFHYFIILFIIIFAFCKPQKVNNIAGNVTFIKGKAKINRKGQTIPVKKGIKFYKGDLITTGPQTVAILSFENNLAHAELQGNTAISISKFDKKIKELSVQKGNFWLKTLKMVKDEKFYVKSPNAVAAVRGTKFFTFEFGDMVGTCFCQGSVDYKPHDKKKLNVQVQDSFAITKDGKTLLFEPDELKYWRDEVGPHKHSLIKNSPVGPPSLKPSPELVKKFMKHVAQKLKKYKK